MEKVNNKEQNGGIFNTLDEYAESYEPAAAALSLGGLGVGMAASATGVGAPIGSAIAIASQIPSTVIDGYQAVRDWYKTAEGNNNLGSALWNTAETGLDLAGAKAAKTLAKGVTRLVEPHVFNPRKPLFSPRKRIADYYRKSWKYEKAKRTAAATKELAKKGVRPSQGNYFNQKLTNLLNKQYQADKARATQKAASYVPRLSPYIQAPLNTVPNIIDLLNR